MVPTPLAISIVAIMTVQYQINAANYYIFPYSNSISTNYFNNRALHYKSTSPYMYVLTINVHSNSIVSYICSAR